MGQDHTGLLLRLRMEEERRKPPLDDGDGQVLKALLAEVNQCAGTGFTTLAELAMLRIDGSGPIVARRIEQFRSEAIRMELLHLLVADRVENCGPLLVRLFRRYRSTWGHEMTHLPGAAEYDNAFWRLKSRRIKKELFALMEDAMSAVELPLTVGMLASWRMPEMKPFLLSCLEGRDRPARDFGLSDGADGQILQYARDALVYRGLHGLRYFPDLEVLEALQGYESCANESMRAAARKSLAYIYRRRGEQP